MLLNEARQLNWIHDLYRLVHSGLLADKTNKLFERILQHTVNDFNANSRSLALYQRDDERLMMIVAREVLNKLIPLMVRQGSPERSRRLTVHPEPVEGFNQRFPRMGPIDQPVRSGDNLSNCPAY
jgi:hypothetical protein